MHEIYGLDECIYEKHEKMKVKCVFMPWQYVNCAVKIWEMIWWMKWIWMHGTMMYKKEMEKYDDMWICEMENEKWNDVWNKSEMNVKKNMSVWHCDLYKDEQDIWEIWICKQM